MAVAAMAIGAVSSIFQGFMGMQQASYQAEVAKMNEDIAKDNARRAEERADIEAEDFSRFETTGLLGEQEAAQSASGLTLTGKSAIRTRATARALGRRDALNIVQGGKIEGYNYRTQAANFRAEADAAKMSGTASLLGGFLGAAGSVAGGIGNTSLMASASPTSRYIPKSVPKPIGLVY